MKFNIFWLAPFVTPLALQGMFYLMFAIGGVSLGENGNALIVVGSLASGLTIGITCLLMAVSAKTGWIEFYRRGKEGKE